MKGLLALLIGLSAAFALAGVRMTVAPLGESEFADTETSTNVAFTASSAADDLLEVRLALHASEMNTLTCPSVVENTRWQKDALPLPILPITTAIPPPPSPLIRENP